tara:strand:- start:240 stop:1379 length:1140 start_codon:yes stop_codon:yes gene_type:complete
MLHPIIKSQNNYVMSKQVISIHGVDKDISKWPQNNEFEITLPHPIQNVSYIKIKDVILPNFLHNISENKENSKIRIQYANPTFGAATNISLHTGDTIEDIQIPDGYYTPVKLASVLQNKINRAVYNKFDVEPFKVVYNIMTNKITVGVTEGNFKLILTHEHKYNTQKCISKPKISNYIDWGLGSILGFEKQDYTGTPVDISTSDRYTQLKTGLTMDHDDTAWLIPSVEQNASNSTVSYIESSHSVNTNKYDTMYIELDQHNYISEIQPYSNNTSSSYNNDLVFKNNSAFAKVSLVKNNVFQASMVAHQLFHMLSFNAVEIISNSHNYNPPIKSLNKLKFKFRHHDGTMAEFDKVSPSLTLEIGCLLEEHRHHGTIRNQF